LVSTRILAANVRTNYSDKALLQSSLYNLRQRRSPLAQETARQLLDDSESHVWLSAALYLGALKDQASVPYLVKALRHTAYLSRPETLHLLREITGTNYYEFEDWTNWWGSRPLPMGFDWSTSLGSGVNLTNRIAPTNQTPIAKPK
jgi:hypothetical protein